IVFKHNLNTTKYTPTSMLTTRTSCWVVEWSRLKPNCSGRIKPSRKGAMRDSRSLSKIFEMDERSEMGRKFCGNSLDFPGLGIRMTLATFQLVGKCCSRIASLNTVTKHINRAIGAARSALDPTPSSPGALRGFDFLMVACSSSR
ncbi:hypothetical protein J6590_108153, partial [Homalodisca vitripennis]